MTGHPARIVPMRRVHIAPCSRIVASSEPWISLGESVNFALSIDRKEAHVFVVGDEPAGFIIFTPLPVFARGGYLRAMGVAAAVRKRGIGKKLLTFAEKTTARHADHFYLCVSSFNRRAQAFYRALGYAKVGTIPGLIKPGASEYIFWKRLR